MSLTIIQHKLGFYIPNNSNGIWPTKLYPNFQYLLKTYLLFETYQKQPIKHVNSLFSSEKFNFNEEIYIVIYYIKCFKILIKINSSNPFKLH